jgi:acetyl esterase/lipase
MVTLHPSIIPRLDPEYAAFHNEHIIHLPQVHELPWDPSIRDTHVVPGCSEPLAVAKVEDFDLSRCCVRVFTPEESRPESGWPALIFFHGGTDDIPLFRSHVSFSHACRWLDAR